MLKIEVLGSPILRSDNSDVDSFDENLTELIEDMFETMDKAKGVGLAAPQIGINKNIFVTFAPKDCKRVFINPKITAKSVEVESAEEGCLSVPTFYGQVQRSVKIVVEALDENGKAFTLKATNFLARVIQHEYDHLQGKIFIDYLPDSEKEKATKKVNAVVAKAKKKADKKGRKK